VRTLMKCAVATCRLFNPAATESATCHPRPGQLVVLVRLAVRGFGVSLPPS